MPQLNKGGKYVFGLSAISNRREILFPAETLEQYPVQKEGRIIIFTGSKITGGFCVTSKQLLGQSKFKPTNHSSATSLEMEYPVPKKKPQTKTVLFSNQMQKRHHYPQMPAPRQKPPLSLKY